MLTVTWTSGPQFVLFRWATASEARPLPKTIANTAILKCFIGGSSNADQPLFVENAGIDCRGHTGRHSRLGPLRGLDGTASWEKLVTDDHVGNTSAGDIESNAEQM
jgi:hypothetical protein